VWSLTIPGRPTSMWSLTIPGRPTSKGNSRRILTRADGRPFTASSAASTRAEQSVRAYAAAHAPAAPLEGPVRLDVTFRYSIPLASRATKRRAAKIVAGEPCTRRVDRGNLLKLIEDALEGIAYLDDSQIVEGEVRKEWGEQNETFVLVACVANAIEQMRR